MAEERPATARKSRKMWRWVVGLGAVLWVGHCAHQNFLFFQARAHAGALLGSLDDYQTRHGHYPEDLHELPSFLELDDSYRERITYTSYERGSNFFLSAIHPFSKQMETYKSEDGRWRAHHLRQLETILEAATPEH